jgi:hypothetical protein
LDLLGPGCKALVNWAKVHILGPTIPELREHLRLTHLATSAGANADAKANANANTNGGGFNGNGRNMNMNMNMNMNRKFVDSMVERGVLLSGPPGNGKTETAKWLADTMGKHIYKCIYAYRSFMICKNGYG